MATGEESTAATPEHYFVEVEEDGAVRYVLCGAVASFDADKVSEATLQGIKALFERQCLRAAPTGNDLNTLPWNFEAYAYQFGKN